MKFRLKDLVQIDSGYAFKSSLFNENEGIPIIRIRDVNSGSSKTLYSGEYDEKYIVVNNDMLISMDGSFVIKKWLSGRALLNQRVCRIKSKDERLLDDYIYRILPLQLKKIEDKTPFVTVKHLSVKDINEIEITLPSIEIQNKVIKTLDTSEALINKRKEQIELLDELVKSRFIEMFGDPIKNNMNWEIKSVGEIAFVTKLAGFEYTQYINYQDEGDVIVVKGLNVKEKKLKLENISYIDKETSDLLPRSQLKKNDLVMTYVGINIGDVALVDGNNRYHLAPNVAKISLLEDSNINPVFMVNLLYMSRILFSSGATNTAKQALNMGRIRGINIMVPPLELQKEFAIFAEQVDKLKFEMEKSLKELEDNFNSLMQKALKGELF